MMPRALPVRLNFYTYWRQAKCNPLLRALLACSMSAIMIYPVSVGWTEGNIYASVRWIWMRGRDLDLRNLAT